MKYTTNRKANVQTIRKLANNEGFTFRYGKIVEYKTGWQVATNGLEVKTAEEVSESTSLKIKSMYKIIGELESLGDSGETISRILSRKNIHNKKFDADIVKNLNAMADAVNAAYDVMIENLTAAHKGELTNISNAYNAEDRINTLRNNLRDAVIENIENDGKNYQTNVYYMDVINAYESMGDFMINVSQDLEKGFIHK